MPLPFEFDWCKPDYARVFAWRIERLNSIRQAVAEEKERGDEPEILPCLYQYYRTHIAQFVTDWGVTFDPRNAALGLPSLVPFVLFPKQEEWIDWYVDHWRQQRNGVTEKSRECGVSWLSVGASSGICLFNEGVVIGFGSRKEEYVDRINGPKSLFFKARMFIENLPYEFRGGWRRDRDAPHMRINFPTTGSYMSGEAGDNIGRGDRCSIYNVDESAYLEHPELIDASLSQTTRSRIDVSSANGMNAFYEKRQRAAKQDLFTFHWRDDPRKNEAWYQSQLTEFGPIIVAQEIDINYAASVEGVLIPAPWVQSAIDAHVKLGIRPTGNKRGALDVADEGYDLNCFASAHGFLLTRCESWSGKGSDTFFTTERAFGIADQDGLSEFHYDADGMGAFVRGDGRVINEKRKAAHQREVAVVPYRGSGGVVDPEKQMIEGRTNEDFFGNMKAQAYWALRARFQKTHRWVHDGIACNPDEIISIAADLPELARLTVELSQPTYTQNTVGKIVVNKMPDGTRSPNHADAVNMLYAPKQAKKMGFFS